jgi:succinate dehydrogenase/fumarate reductase-like Fe-S protein
MRVNGKVVLACVEPVTCDLTIEPVSTTSVAKDLVTSAKDFKARTIQRAPVDIRRRLR